MSGLISAFVLIIFALDANIALASAKNVKHSVLGVISSNENREGVALINHLPSERVRAYKVGHYIDKKTKLVKVERKFITLRMGSNSINIPVGEGVSSTFSSTPQNVASSYQGIEKKNDTLTIQSSLKKHLVENQLGQILMQAGTIPHFAQGVLMGFKLFDIDAGSIYETIGFKNGDVITHINGQQLNDAAVAIRVLKTLKNSDRGEVTYLRNGQEKNINIVVN